MAGPRERRECRPTAIFDVRDHYREHQADDGLAATVTGPVRFAVDAVVTPSGRLEPTGWSLDTRRTLSGLSVFLNRILEGPRGGAVRTLPPSTTSLELRVSSPRFQTQNVTFSPGPDPYRKVDLDPAVDYPFTRLAPRPDEPGPTLLRGSVADADAKGVAGAEVSVAQGVFDYGTEPDGAFVIVLPDSLPWRSINNDPNNDPNKTIKVFDVDVRVTLSPATRQTATVLPDPSGASPWTRTGPIMTCAVTAVRGATGSIPPLRLRLT